MFTLFIFKKIYNFFLYLVCAVGESFHQESVCNVTRFWIVRLT